MPGRRTHEAGSNFVTEIASYREDIDGADGPVVEVAKSIDCRQDANGNFVKNGKDAALFVYAAFFAGMTGATIELWTPVDLWEFPLKRDAEAEDAPASSSPSPTDWYLVESVAITGNERIVFADLVPSVYRLRVASVSGAGTLNLHEQHSE